MNKTKLTEIPLIVLTGTNGSGKSALGIQLAQKYDGEIISADSRQIFKGLDLCCGKVTPAERAMVPHHMLDVCRIGEPYSVSDYQTAVYELMRDIYDRGRLPFLVGGTGLYVDAVVKGYDFKTEETDFSLRDELELKSVEELQSMISPAARAELKKNNSDYNNKRRLERIIAKEAAGNALVSQNRPLHRVLEIGVTWPKEQLHSRIDERLKKRIEDGMPDEVRQYLAEGGDPGHLYDLGLDYKYTAQYLEGKFETQDAYMQELARADKRFAKQQLKWLKRDPSIHWIDMTKDPLKETSELIDRFLSQKEAQEQEKKKQEVPVQ